MNKTFVKGMMTGAAIGAAVGMIMDPIKDKNAKTMKKNTSKAFRTLGSVIDGILDMRM